MRMKSLLLMMLFLCVLPTAKAGLVYEFDVFTDNGRYADDPALNMFMEVSEQSDGHVLFEVYNGSTLSSSSIANVYFEAKDYLGDLSIINGLGVWFVDKSSPSKMGGGLKPKFSTSDSIGAHSPAPFNGINAGEVLGISFDLKRNKSYTDVVSAINSGNLRVGLHITSLPDCSSEWAVNSTLTPPVVPEPASIALLGFGSIAMCYRRKKKTAL